MGMKNKFYKSWRFYYGLIFAGIALMVLTWAIIVLECLLSGTLTSLSLIACIVSSVTFLAGLAGSELTI